jgi:hypothetical protein
LFSGAAGGGVRISVSGEPKVPGAASTIAEEAVDQLQENEKLVAGKQNCLANIINKSKTFFEVIRRQRETLT